MTLVEVLEEVIVIVVCVGVMIGRRKRADGFQGGSGRFFHSFFFLQHGYCQHFHCKAQRIGGILASH